MNRQTGSCTHQTSPGAGSWSRPGQTGRMCCRERCEQDSRRRRRHDGENCTYVSEMWERNTFCGSPAAAGTRAPTTSTAARAARSIAACASVSREALKRTMSLFRATWKSTSRSAARCDDRVISTRGALRSCTWSAANSEATCEKKRDHAAGRFSGSQNGRANRIQS